MMWSEERTRTLCLGLLVACLAGCGEAKQSPGEAAGAAPAADERPAAPAAGGGGAAAEMIEQGLTVPADHKPTSAEDREALAAVYLSFAEDPEGFVAAVEKLAPERRQRLGGFLICAAAGLHRAGQPAKAGAPRQIALPPEADELIDFAGSPEHARTMFLRQLGGEFMIVGRSIQSIDKGDKQLVEQILARQQQNLEMMKLAYGPDKAAKWSATIRRVFPILFARLLPEC
jgi:hypothetical protein